MNPKGKPLSAAKQDEPVKQVHALAQRKRTPSINSYLSGKVPSETSVVNEPATIKRNFEEHEEPFTQEMLVAKWKEFAKRYADEPQIYSLFAKIPELKEKWLVIIPIENSVQQSNLWEIKPALTGFLHRELKNTKIEIESEIVESDEKALIYNDSDKLKAMAEKNPNLLLLKQKFNLDFNS